MSEAEHVEIAIQRVLDAGIPMEGVVDQFLERIKSPETSDADRMAYWKFLYHAGYFTDLLESLKDRLSAKQRIHWGLIVQTLARAKINPSKTSLECFFKGLKRQNANEDLWACDGWDALDPRFPEIRAKLNEKKAEEADQRRASLVEKFHFLISQRMHEQAGRVINRLIYLYPSDKEYRNLKAAFNEDWAREVLSNRYSDPTPERVQEDMTKANENIHLVALWEGEAVQLAIRKPKDAYNLAILFFLMDADVSALRLAQMAQDAPARDWLVCEILLKLKRYVDLLDKVQDVELKYGDDAETAFACAYLRAQAIHALGQTSVAIEILRNIVQVRPNYRSANQWIAEWSVGAATG